MGRILHICGADGGLKCQISAQDDSMILTSMGRKRADSLSDCTKATLQIDGQDANGDVTYTSKHGGLVVNNITIEHTAGLTGASYENRSLGVYVTDMAVQIVYGTDGSGNSVVPTAGEVETLINNDEAASDKVSASSSGDGSGLVSQSPPTNLAGGLDDGDYYKFPGNPPSCNVINLIEVV